MSVARVNSGLQVTAAKYQDLIQAFTVQIATPNPSGPTPGSVVVTPAGVDIALDQLSALGGLVQVRNLGTLAGDTSKEYYIEVGLRDVISDRFYPLYMIYPGEQYPGRLSINLLQDFPGTGTGPGSGTVALHARANNQPCRAFFGAFDP